MSINFKNAEGIYNSQIGNGNIMINNAPGIPDETWDKFSKFLESSMDKLDEQSDNYKLAGQAKQFVDYKDHAGLSNLLKNNFATFMGNVFAGLASTELYNLIQTFIK